MHRFSNHQRIRGKGLLCTSILLLFLAFTLHAAVKNSEEGEPEGETCKTSAAAEGEETTEEEGKSEPEPEKEMTEENKEERQIRVLIKTTGYRSIFWDKLEVTGTSDVRLSFGEGEYGEELILPEGTQVTFTAESDYFDHGERVVITCEDSGGILTVGGLIRSLGKPGFRGNLEIQKTPDGMVLIHQLALEDYLCSVVPSEMPCSYPEEALKAQAVCARTYAYGKIINAGYPQYGAHLDDSTSFQVFRNQKEDERTNAAVRATKGMVLWTKEGELAQTFYYSTSCGRGTNADVWRMEGTEGFEALDYLKGKRISQTAVNAFLEGKRDEAMEDDAVFLLGEDVDDYEQGEAWYRWTYEIKKLDVKALAGRISEAAQEKVEPFQKIYDLKITNRAMGGAANELEAVTDQGTIVIRGERNVRRVLCDGKTKAVKKDQSASVCESLLPSAFLLIEMKVKGGAVTGYVINGGGYGHGIGMSQNAARNMALDGKKAEEILGFFFEDCLMRPIP